MAFRPEPGRGRGPWSRAGQAASKLFKLLPVVRDGDHGPVPGAGVLFVRPIRYTGPQ